MNKRIQKGFSLILSLALVLSTFAVPSVTKTVYASESAVAAPTTGTYLAKADFTSDSFNDTYGLATDSQIAKKVYFGTNSDIWWMAGVEDVTGSDISATTLVLFSSKALTGKVAYNTPSTLANYATSYIRNNVLEGLLSNRFSPSEKEAIVPVTLGYKGYETSKTSIASMTVTNCKLYLPDADGTGQNQMLKVGQSNIKVKNTADEIGAFWLRSAHDNNYDIALMANLNPGRVSGRAVYTAGEVSLASALNMNLTSVIFSSAAPAAASTDTDLTSGTTMTLRFNSAQTVTGSDCADRIQSSATANADGVTIANPTNTEFLYVQWSKDGADKVKSVELGSQTSFVSASNLLGAELNENCKIWLEKKVDNITYAKNVEFSNKQETALTVTTSSLKVAEGETVKITVAAAGTSYAGIKAVLNFDNSKFNFVTVTDIANGGDIKVTGSNIIYQKASASLENVGNLFKATFTANADVILNSSGEFKVSGEYTDSRDNVATEDAATITAISTSVSILKVFKDENKPVEPTTKTAIFDGQGRALYTSPTEIVTNSTIVYSYTKDNKTVTSTTIPQVTDIGTYKNISYTISANGYKTFTSTPTIFTINGPEYKAELISDYTNGKALILVFTNADLDKQNVNVKYANNKMYKLENSGYAVSGSNVTYTNVYGIIAENSSESNLTPDGVKNNITFVGGSTNTSINCGNCDVNGRGSVDITDAVAAINVYNNYWLYFQGEDKWNKIILKSDVNHDKIVDTGDVAMILKENAKAYK